jgi:beta-glucosidase
MTRLQKAQQMVSAVNPADSDVMANQYGSILSGGSNNPVTGNTPGDWAAMTDSYLQDTVSSTLAIPEIYALDAVHGNSHPSGTVIFPHNIGLASSRNAALVTQVGQMAALESIATGVTMTYAPQASVAWDARWGRFYETYSEDVDWVAEMAAAEVEGLQGVGGLGTGTPGIIACMKHWAGDGQAAAGCLSPGNCPGTSHTGGIVDRADIEIDQAQMEQYGMAPYLPAIQAGLGCMMVSDTTWNGTWITSDPVMITTLLKGMYGFKGFVLSDWNAPSVHSLGLEATVNAGVDMMMMPDAPPASDSWQATVTSIANSTAIADSRIDDAVTRILNVKCQAGLFGFKRDTTLLPSVGSAAHRTLARQAVAQSLVVLQNNDNVLPLSKTATVWVGGSGSNNLSNQCGGWTINWQGDGDATTGTTISQAIGKVTTLATSMDSADVEVVVLSETPYAETPGDSATLDTLWTDTNPQGADFTLLQQARASGKPVVAIILSGRTALINSPNHPNALSDADAWIAAWLPGTEGDGVADILFGDVHPTGKLTHSWRSSDSQANFMTCCNTGTPYSPLFPLGFGLTY